MGRSLRPLSLGILLLVACADPTPVIYDPDTGVFDAGSDDLPSVTEAAVDVGRADAVVDASVDVPMDADRACRTVDDCTAADLCTNAQACRLGRCVLVGGPASCDDAVACTDDSCDATAGRCVHAANDMRCPADNFCAQESGCVRELPCEIGDTTCARLNGNPCTGTWSCEAARLRCVRSAAYNCDDMDTCTVDTCTVSGTAPMCAHRGPEYQTDVANCGTCGTRCTAGANQTATCAMGACAYACADGFADADRTPANGCECNVRAADAPDMMFQDTNCDGIDGDATVAVFVSPRGSDSNPGTRDMPLHTIAAAINLARMGTPPRPVYVAQGTYRSSVELVGGVSLYGGYDDLSGWARSRDTSSVIQGDTTAVFANELARATELQLLTIQSAGATTPGGSSYGVRVVNGSALLTLRGCTISAGSGASAPGGSNGATGSNGSAGSSGGTPIGGGGSSPCGATGGAGGASGSGGTNGSGGSLGATASGGASGGGGGAGATRGTACIECFGTCAGVLAASPPAAGAASNGNDGRNGNNGRSASSVGSADGTTGIYLAPSGVSGTDAAAGGGGGGGGAGTGGSALVLFPPSCVNHNGGGGGGGGGGGCAGTSGSGGSGGGGSFAVMSASSNLRIEECRLSAGRGGNGGNGGNGGSGGAGGNGGAGGGFAGNAGGGGAGARGGAGGTGGSGSGGPGGPSVCVYYLGSSPSISGLTCTRGGGGTGGEGGRTTALGDAPDGATGPSDEVRAGL